MARRRRTPIGYESTLDVDPDIVPQSEREILSAWMKERLETIEREARERIETLRTVGEHPSPIFASMVKNFGVVGIEIPVAARLMNTTGAIIRRYYLADYEAGRAEVIASVASNMYRIATSTTHPDAARVGMDLLARRGGEEWRPPSQKLEISKAPESAPLIDSSKLTPEERAQLRAMLERAAGASDAEQNADSDPAQDCPLIEAPPEPVEEPASEETSQ